MKHRSTLFTHTVSSSRFWAEVFTAPCQDTSALSVLISLTLSFTHTHQNTGLFTYWTLVQSVNHSAVWKCGNPSREQVSQTIWRAGEAWEITPIVQKWPENTLFSHWKLLMTTNRCPEIPTKSSKTSDFDQAIFWTWKWINLTRHELRRSLEVMFDLHTESRLIDFWGAGCSLTPTAFYRKLERHQRVAKRSELLWTGRVYKIKVPYIMRTYI